jgi:hypothetical protein
MKSGPAIAAGIGAALALIFLLGVGYGQQWGAPQWGPLAEWIAGAATFAAVVVALKQSIDAQRESRHNRLDRLVDHEISRRRECIQALANLWAAITSTQMDFATWIEDLVGSSNPSSPAISERTRKFAWEWQNRIDAPLLVALLVLRRATPLYEAVAELNKTINKIKDQLNTIDGVLLAHQHPDTQLINTLWDTVLDQRNAHLKLARQQLTLDQADVERYVQQKWNLKS